jgi:alpha-1,3-glucosyltransferase
MFGWHVHEKAVMLILVPLRSANSESTGHAADISGSLLATEDWNHYQAFVVASVSGIISLFPLLFMAAG